MKPSSRLSAFPPFRLRGFTLIEILTAIAITGILLLTAHRVFVATADAARRVRTDRLALDRSINAERWLEAAFASLDVGQEGSAPFEGRRNRVRFSTWLETPDGWFQRREVEIKRNQDRVVATGAGSDILVLKEGIARLEFDYLLEMGAAATWATEWISPASAPYAVRLRSYQLDEEDESVEAADTLLLLIRGRG
ncbi:MAG TPA: prepilin-type N-terminal cleavage/methylation domain-containing protein [Gemmatimonadales bacterium]|nr:prepilin-type N-terminal cleavage/methylation domain-containing protein [Gemmatimonadales bacterium]